MSTARMIIGDARDVVATLDTSSVDLVLTSPPFLALRSYLPADDPNKGREIGTEASPADYLQVLLELTAEWYRVLAPHGSIVVELGDTYSGSGGGGGDYLPGGLRDGQPGFGGSAEKQREGNAAHWRLKNQRKEAWPLPKSLCGIPHLYHLSLAYGRHLLTGEDSPAGQWRVRNVVVWVRPNPPVGALGDKFRPATSYMTIATFAKDRWFDLDAVRTPVRHPNATHTLGDVSPTRFDHGTPRKRIENSPVGVPPLDWWNISPGGYPGSHYAVFPEELCRIPIESMCPRRVCRTCGKPSRRETKPSEKYASRPNAGRDFHGPEHDRGRGHASRTERRPGNDPARQGAEYETTGWTSCGCPGADGIRLDGYHTGSGWRPGIVLDPFAGSGTVGDVATGRSRDAVLVDIDPRNADLARERIGLFLTVEEMST